MSNEQNLRTPSTEVAREIGRKGGINSAIAKRARKTLREELIALLESEDIQQKMSVSLIKEAIDGNKAGSVTKAFEVIRDTIGEKPVEKIMMAEVDPHVIDEVEGIVYGRPTAKKENIDMTGKILKINAESGAIVNTYPTASKAARENGLDPSNLAKAIKSGKMLGGFKWQKRE